MPTKNVWRAPDPAPSADGNWGGLGFDSDNDLLIGNSDGTARPYATDNVEVLTASKTTTAAASGTTFVANSTTSIVVTLPATVAGLKYTMVLEGLTTSGGHAFSPAAADQIRGNGLTAADDKDVICTAASDREGDSITLVGDGVDGWYITAVTGTWAIETS